MLLLLLVLGLTSCQTTPRASAPPPFDLSEPGWQVREGQAVWTPGRKTTSLAGELLVAQHTDGRCLVQFAKPPFTFVVAVQRAGRWQIEFPPARARLAGALPPPARFPWLHLPGFLNDRPLPREWAHTREAQGHWRLENRATGEILEGFLGP